MRSGICQTMASYLAIRAIVSPTFTMTSKTATMFVNHRAQTRHVMGGEDSFVGAGRRTCVSLQEAFGMILRNITSSEPGASLTKGEQRDLSSAIWLLVLNSLRSRAAACALDLKGGDFGESIQQARTEAACLRPTLQPHAR
jgi:hypothetical protein